MLRELRLKNLALIKEATVTFGAGLTVITGESGSGKSLIIRGLSLALGARSDKDDVGASGGAMALEATFSATSLPTSKALLHDLSLEKGEDITLRREVASSGRSRAFVNEQLRRLDQLQEIGAALCHTEGQASGARLRQEKSQLTTIDNFAGISAQVAEMGEVFDQWERRSNDIATLQDNRLRLDGERELLEFQLQELEKAQLSLGEEEQLGAEKKRLDAAEKLISASGHIAAGLESENSPLEQLAELNKLSQEIKSADEGFAETADLLDSAMIQLQEFQRNVDEYRSSLSVDDERLNEINERLSEIYRLKSKYGGSVENSLLKLEAIRKRLSEIPNTGKRLGELQREEKQLREAYSKLACSVRRSRLQAAKKLARLTMKELASLAMESCSFEFRFQWEESADGVSVEEAPEALCLRPARHGLETGVFYFSANPGEEMKQLTRVASGGEMSRVALALNVAQRVSSTSGSGKKSKSAQITTVYDEIDSGVSGTTATAMGRKLKELAQDTQVIVVTHLRQVVAFADQHLLVEKAPVGGRNEITVRKLNAEESEREALKLVDMESVVS